MHFSRKLLIGAAILSICALSVSVVFAAPCSIPLALGEVPVFPGSDECVLDPATINKYEIPLVIPPVMNNDGVADSYDIAVREFPQQILPGGLWNTLGATTQTFPATTVWSYGPAADPTPAVAPDPASQFNYPAYTVETKANVPVNVRWINDLVDPATGNSLPHILPIDQTLHWANPLQDCRMGDSRTDCAGVNPDPYMGPVPIVTHVHGAHVDPHSDGYPEAWWLPAANDIVPCITPGNPAECYATSGTLFDDATGMNDGTLGYADYLYRQDQPATTLWYHDHSLGMTRNNVYAGPAGFWLMRGGPFDGGIDTSTGKSARLPSRAPRAGQSVLELNLPTHNIRQSVREIPIAIQDRDFQPGGSQLYYPDNRARFEDLNPAGGTAPSLEIEFVPDSDVAPIWNPEAFFNVMVVNGVSWPVLEVAQAKYRLRFLNGCNSRFLILKFDNPDVEVWQIGAEQGFLPAPIRLNDFTYPQRTVPANDNAYILMALAERADTIVDFSALADGTTVTLLNIGPDEPFGGGVACLPGDDPDEVEECDFAPADPASSGQVMKFVVNAALNGKGQTDPTRRNGRPNPQAATDPANLLLNAEPALGPETVTRQVSLNELDSADVCVVENEDGNVVQVEGSMPPDCAAGGEPFGPLEALLGTVTCYNIDGGVVDCNDTADVDSFEGNPLKWTDAGTPKQVLDALGNPLAVVNVTENPALGATEVWEMYNFTADAHPIHLHLVRFEVVGREPFAGGLSAAGSNEPLPWEGGFKDTTISYPDEITRVRALFDIEGLYVWHCHIVEHEDNEMMRPYFVGN